ncbi:uncharacterized protein PGTG_18818 [Puccinia graminis f. sp. tritici CRL 75-36-700-3]|uniref:Uncharacterized protein n=1 Tax=Puccinia graminis f. sp. tritici (strain CRL 75-36-700-3 / race SCCL) TaxID=418459 RepID=E3L8M5_PUCGT|nr:uncharacterized protein PGTG_18818 [Puccinia graminis f. sp. tritici CRL 75-36-700-3]EFP92900.2 hypothetical protein PGTG_18818 [Puccinia graminis f. sp. tritici CRL 75-36-700-3]
MKKFSCSPLWLTALIIAPILHLPSTACSTIPKASPVLGQPILSKRAVIVPPRFVIIPIFGPVSFTEIFNWGCPTPTDNNRVGHGGYESRVKQVATQAIDQAVVEQYAKAHPEMAKEVSLDLREILRLEEQSGQLVSQIDHARVIKARADLARFFEAHPELQAQAEDTFQEQVDALFRSRDSADWEAANLDQVASRDWAHLTPQDDSKYKPNSALSKFHSHIQGHNLPRYTLGH